MNFARCKYLAKKRGSRDRPHYVERLFPKFDETHVSTLKSHAASKLPKPETPEVHNAEGGAELEVKFFGVSFTFLSKFKNKNHHTFEYTKKHL